MQTKFSRMLEETGASSSLMAINLMLLLDIRVL
jgi:hypothetical protein